jgi:two-component system nitrogen regulation response regulator GlnG
MVQRLGALYSQEVIGIDVIEAELADTSSLTSDYTEGTDGLSGTVEQQLNTYFSAHGSSLPAAGLYDRVLREVERPLITLTLQATRGNQVKAADVLGLNRNTLRKKIRELDIAVVRGAK